MVAAVAPANKMTRTIWSMSAKGGLPDGVIQASFQEGGHGMAARLPGRAIDEEQATRLSKLKAGTPSPRA